MLPTSIRLALLAVVALRLSLGPAYAAPHALRRGERDGSLNVHESIPGHKSGLDTRQISGIIDAITDAGEAGSDAAKAAKGGSSAKASKSTKSEAKDQNKGNSTSTPHAVIAPVMDIRETGNSSLDTRQMYVSVSRVFCPIPAAIFVVIETHTNLSIRRTGIIDAITDAGEAGSDAAKAAKGGSSAKASKSTKSEAKDQNKGNSTSTPHAVFAPVMDIREIGHADHDEHFDSRPSDMRAAHANTDLD
ncbi:hypothetical protein DFH05DRAFT_1520123 [Lentinula detonsa]|uniref:Uncharacterized protein n=1 Tax=Lentinula detonsa TaxID=2804962 RepID=A0A9W8U1B7_9AGAR|nr:hypothetical protein DFH05DRAFT_1520123 [Lentinula detonsa]